MVPLTWISDSHFSSRKKWGKEATDDHPDTNSCSKLIGTIRAFYLSNCHSRKGLISTGTLWAMDGEMSEVNPGLLPAKKKPIMGIIFSSSSCVIATHTIELAEKFIIRPHWGSGSVWSSALKMPLKPMERLCCLRSKPWRTQDKSLFSKQHHFALDAWASHHCSFTLATLLQNSW